jgi:hypothetical protein
MDERNRRVYSNQQQNDAETNASITGQSLRTIADCDSPIHQEQPNAVREMPDG